MYLIIIIFCKYHVRNTVNFLAKIMSIYFYENSVKQQVLEMLIELKVCNDYKYINQLINNITENVKKNILIINFIKLYN